MVWFMILRDTCVRSVRIVSTSIPGPTIYKGMCGYIMSTKIRTILCFATFCPKDLTGPIEVEGAGVLHNRISAFSFPVSKPKVDVHKIPQIYSPGGRGG